MKRFDYTSVDGNASDAPALHLKEEKITDVFLDQFSTEINFEAQIKWFSDPESAGYIVSECIVNVVDYCIETGDSIRESVRDVIGSHFSGRVTFEQTIEIV